MEIYTLTTGVKMAFQELIKEWETFYLMVGTAAVTLIGLLFVAISIHIENFHRKTSTELHHFATLTFNCFFYVLLMAILFLVPRLSPLALGIPLLLLSGLGIANMLIQKTRIKKLQTKRQNGQIANRFNVPIACLAGLLIISIGTLFQIALSLYGMLLVIIFLLASASQNAWALLVQIEDKK
jgi:hypothetical protein